MDISVKIDKLKKALKSPTTPEALKGQLQKQIENLEAQIASEDKGILPHPKKPKVGDFVKVNVSYGNFHFGKITADYSDEKFYVGSENGYQVTGIGDRLKPEQFEVISKAEYDKGILPHPKPKKPTVARNVKKVTKKYYAHRDIKSVTVIENGKKVVYKGEDVLNGAQFLAKGGKVEEIATYYPVRAIVEVTFTDNTIAKPINGYHIKNDAKPIAELGAALATEQIINNSIVDYQNPRFAYKEGGETDQIIDLYPLQLVPLSTQLQKITGDSLNTSDYVDENGNEYSTNPNSIIVHKNSGKKFRLPLPIFTYIDGYNLVHNIFQKKITVYETGALVAEIKDGKLDFTNKDQSVVIDRTKVRKQFENGFIPDAANAKNFYKDVEQELLKQYALYEDVEDNKDSEEAKKINKKIQELEGFLHKLERKYAKGGTTEEGVDLFEDYYNIPADVQEVLDTYSQAFEDGDYEGLAKAHEEVNKLGYTFDYYLDGQAYDLRKIGQKGKVELAEEMGSEEFAKGGETSTFNYKNRYDENKIKSKQDVIDFYKYLVFQEDLGSSFGVDNEFKEYYQASPNTYKKVFTKKQSENLEKYNEDAINLLGYGSNPREGVYAIQNQVNSEWWEIENKFAKGGETSGSGDFDYIKFLDYVQPKVAATLLENNVTLLNDYTIVHDGKEYEPEIIYKGINGKANALSVGYFADNDSQLKLLLSIDFELEEMEYHIRSKGWNINDVDMYAKGGWVKDHKYLNKAEAYEMRYAKGKNRKGYMAKGGEVDFSNLSVELSAKPNPDFDRYSHEGTINIKSKKVKVKSIDEAISKVRNFINDNDLGGGNFTGGTLYDGDKKIGRISYNGRVWDMNDNEMYAKGGILNSDKKAIIEIFKKGQLENESFQDMFDRLYRAIETDKELLKLKENYDKGVVSSNEFYQTLNHLANPSQRKKITSSDIKMVEQEFKTKNGTIFVVKGFFNYPSGTKGVETFVKNDPKNTYKDSIEEFVDILNDEKAFRIYEKGGTTEVFDYKNQYVKSKIKKLSDVRDFFKYLHHTEKISFHPDDQFEGNMSDNFTKEQAKNLDNYMSDCFTVCEKENVEIYGEVLLPMELDKEGPIVGRKAKGVSVKKIADMHNVTEKYLRKQLQRGQKVELEHTTDEAVAYAIAKDHIYENPDYYILLEKIEMKAKGGQVNDKVKIVVLDEHTLGYIDPKTPDFLNILHASVLKGSPYSNLSDSITIKGKKVRLATEKDFDDFRVSSGGYRENDIYEYERLKTKSKSSQSTNKKTKSNLLDNKGILPHPKPKREGSKIFAKAAEIREPGEKWQEAVRRANLLLKK